MDKTVTAWLDIADRIHNDWGVLAFVLVTYSFTALFAISQVRGVRLDRQFSKKRRLSKLQTRGLAFVIGAPMEFLFCYLAGFEFDIVVTHAAIAGALSPVVADIWIGILRWRGCHGQVSMFKVDGERRAGDRRRRGESTEIGDDTGDFTRL